MYIIFYTVNIVYGYIFVFMIWSTSYRLCGTGTDPWKVCMVILFKLSNGLLVLLNDVNL